MRDFQGFTLIELMIAVALMIILSVMAVSTYQFSMKKNYRKEAQANLRDLAGEIEKSMYQHDGYDYSVANALLGSRKFTTDSVRYTFSILQTTTTGYELRATLKAGFTDTSCTTLIMKSNGEFLPEECW